MKDLPNKYKCIPFWSWNDELDEKELVRQIDWMHESGVGGFFMHARGGLTTPYLGDKWFKCVEACLKRAKELNMEAYAYDENGWPSGFAGGKLLEDEQNCDQYLSYKQGEYDPNALVSFDISTDKAIRVYEGNDVMNIYLHTSISTADILNKDVVRKFINLTHEEYKKHDIYGNLRGFFTDEPQYYRWGTPFTRVLPKYFKEHYNEDVYDRLALLFVNKEGYRDFKYKYFKAMQDLMLNSFAKQIYEWCDENGYKLTGHYVEETSLGYQVNCCGGVMPFYEYEHIPGIDHLGRSVDENPSARQLGSVAAQLNKEQTICEEFACVGWDTTPRELRHIAEHYAINGVTIMCHHLLPYSEHGQRKRDYPEHYSSVNPWVDKGFKTFNDYFTKIGYLISNSKEKVNVGIFHPIRTAYFEFQRFPGEPIGFNVSELNSALYKTMQEFYQNNIAFHFLDEVIMAKHAKVVGNTLVINDYAYKYIVISPLTLTMDETTMKLFKEYAKNGGKFLIMGDVPTYLGGQEFNHDYMVNNTSLEEIKNDQPFMTSRSESIRVSMRIDKDKKSFFYVLNNGKEADIHIVFDCKSFTDEEGKTYSHDLHLDEYQSLILYPSDKEFIPEAKKNLLVLKEDYQVLGSPENYLTLDMLEFSKDGKNYSKRMYHLGAFYNLLKENYKGDLYLRYTFELKAIPNKMDALIEDCHNLSVKVNGVEVNKIGTSQEKDLWVYDVKTPLKLGLNELIVKINYYNQDIVHDILFSDAQESLRNCLSYDTTLEAVFLRGDFSVYGDVKDGEQENHAVATKFYIDKPNKNVKCLVKDGYPFFRGQISLEQKINVKDVNQILYFEKRFQMIDVYVNGEFVKRMMFENKVDLSKHLKLGENTIRLDLVVSNRNLMGPFHYLEEEPMAIGPYTFERFGEWDEDGNAPTFKERYSFVKTII